MQSFFNNQYQFFVISLIYYYKKKNKYMNIFDLIVCEKFQKNLKILHTYGTANLKWGELRALRVFCEKSRTKC